MASKCPKCGREVPADSIYCPYCAHGLKPSARTTQVSTGATLLFVAAAAHVIIFVVSVRSLANIYSWYPLTVAQGWIVYDQALTALSLVGFLSGVPAGLLALVRKSYIWTMVTTIICTGSGLGAWVVSMVIPFANFTNSLLYYFLPMFLTASVASALIFPRKTEFK